MTTTAKEIRQPEILSPGSDWRTLLAVTFTVLAWASAFVVIRYAAHDIDPGALSLGRLLVASLALSAMMIGRKLVRMTAREWAFTALVGVAWFAVYSVALNAGEQHVDAGTAAMLIQLAPILIGILAGILLGEGFPRMLVIGGLVAFVGTLIIGFATSTGQADLAGVLLVLLSATVYSIAMVAQKVVLRRIPALQVTWLACLIGTAACLPFAADLVRDLAAAPALPIIGVVYLGIVPTALAFSTWAYALSHTSAGKLGVTTFAVPPITILLGWLLLGEVPPVLAIVGGALSLVGVAIARRRAIRPSRRRVTVPSGT
ncbi:MAG TPA: DMT family transporter [Propionibacteriaceae bacterium]|nr:DMT family transporter [Propionibacteriaceae bacterium]